MRFNKNNHMEISRVKMIVAFAILLLSGCSKSYKMLYRIAGQAIRSKKHKEEKFSF